MPVTVNVNGLSLVHMTSGGIATATLPDVCNTPGPSGPVPVPYPNIAMSTDLVQGTTTIKVDGGSSAAIQGSKFVKSTGDEPGAAGGLASGTFAMEAAFLSFSPTVMFEGKGACRLTDKMLMNKGNTACLAGCLNPPVPPPAPPGELAMSGGPLMSEAPKLCTVRDVQVMCGHSTRSFLFDPAKQKPTDHFHLVLKNGKPEAMSVRLQQTCGFGHADCPKLVLIDPDGHSSDLSGKRDFSLAPPASAWTWMNWPELVRFVLFPSSPAMQLYVLRIVSCRNVVLREVRIAVHQYVKWEASLEIGYAHGMSTVTVTQTESRRDFAKRKAAHDEKQLLYRPELRKTVQRDDILTTKKSLFELDPVAQWKVTGKFTAEYGQDKYEFSDSVASKVDARNADPLTENVFKFLRTHLGRLGLFFQKARAHGLLGGVEPRWPKFILSGKLELTEDTDSPWAHPQGTFRMAFDPLFGAQLKFDCFNFFIDVGTSFFGPAGRVLAAALKKVRELASEGAQGKSFGVKADIRLDFIVGGDVKGELDVQWDRKGTTLADGTGVEGGIDFSLIGKVSAVARAWKFVALGAAEVGIKSSDGLGASRLSAGYKKSPSGLGWIVTWNGLAFAYSAYCELGIGGEEAKPPPPKEKIDSSRTGPASETPEQQKAKMDALKQRLREKHRGAEETKHETAGKQRNRVAETAGQCVLFKPFTWPDAAAAASKTPTAAVQGILLQEPEESA